MEHCKKECLWNQSDILYSDSGIFVRIFVFALGDHPDMEKGARPKLMEESTGRVCSVSKILYSNLIFLPDYTKMFKLDGNTGDEQLDLVCLESIAGVWNFQTEYFEI